MNDSTGYDLLRSNEMKVLGLVLLSNPIKITEARNMRVLVIEILDNLVVKKIVQILSSVLGGWYEFRPMDTLPDSTKYVL